MVISFWVSFTAWILNIYAALALSGSPEAARARKWAGGLGEFRPMMTPEFFFCCVCLVVWFRKKRLDNFENWTCVCVESIAVPSVFECPLARACLNRRP